MRLLRLPSPILATVFAALSFAPVLRAQGQPQGGDAALQKRIAALEDGQKAILKELQEIKALLAAPPAAPAAQAQAAPLPTVVSIANAASRGDAKAPLTLVEFSDFQCPFCGRYSRETFAQIQKQYVDTGKVHYVFRNLPLQGLHPQAFGAAVGAECARAQGKFWELHDRLFANQNGLAQPAILKSAEVYGLDLPKFQACLSAPAAAEHVRKDLADAAALGSNATPAFFVGVKQADGQVRILQRIVGAKPYETFASILDTLLTANGAAR
ncbi:MAG: thioredoxin domain-containing protein [Acidobacteria bacterium]|nr:thioredoxin domain-containing protein [Acidobacteriota bacterium]